MQVIIQLCPLYVFKDEEELSLCIYNVIETHYVLVLKFLEDVYFTNDTFLTTSVHQVELLVNLDG